MTITPPKGFSLIELLVVSALAGGVMLEIISLFNSLGRSQKSVTQSGDFENLVLLIKMALQNPLTCPPSLQDAAGVQVAPPASVTVAAPDLPAAGIAVSKISIGGLVVDTTVPYNGMFIQSLRLNQVVKGSPSAANPIPYTANLRIQGSKTAAGATGAVGGGALFKDIPLSLDIRMIAGAATIVGCSTRGVSTAGTVQAMFCANASADPVCVSARQNFGAGDGTARVVNCRRNTAVGPYNTAAHQGVVGLHLRYDTGAWRYYNTANVLENCVDGTALVLGGL